MKKIYTCDICSKDIHNPEKMYGVYFSGRNQFTLGGYGCTEGKHICFDCAVQLRKRLTDKQITEELERHLNETPKS